MLASHDRPTSNEYVFEYIESSKLDNVLTMPLIVREVEAVQPRSKPYGVADGDGLVLWVTPEGNKFWHFRYRLHGKQRRLPRRAQGGYGPRSAGSFPAKGQRHTFASCCREPSARHDDIVD